MEIENFSANDPSIRKNSPQRILFEYVHVRCFFHCILYSLHCVNNTYLKENNAKYELYTIDQRKFENFLRIF